jgi:L-amino acid N-acyltransferase YncA
MQIKIRIANIDDLDAINDIYNQAIEAGNATADLHPLKPKTRKEWFDLHDANSYPVYIIEMKNKILGWGSLSPYRKGRGALKETAEISYYIHYNYHGIGLGKQLIAYMISDCKRLGLKNLLALLLEINQASIRMLEKFGFERWGYLPDIVKLRGRKCAHLIYGKQIAS